MKQYVLFLSMLFCCANFSLKAETFWEMIDRKMKDFKKKSDDRKNSHKTYLQIEYLISGLFANHPENECAEYREEALKHFLSSEEEKKEVVNDICEKISNHFARTVRDEDHLEDHSMEKVKKMKKFLEKYCENQ